MTALTLITLAAAVGGASGTHAAIWGMYKDAAHEGFGVGCFARSILVGAGVGVVLYGSLGALLPHAAALTLPSPAGLLLLFGLSYAGERGVVEVWKTFIRDEDQAKYTIPMQFNLLGAPVTRGARVAVGGVYAGVVISLLYGIALFEAPRPASASMVVVALSGVFVGLLIAVGGAWKDAPTEGFELLKFFRSPALTLAYALLFSTLTSSYLEMTVAAIGYERATAETYKTFLRSTKTCGKFAGKPVLFPELLATRRYFVPVFVAIWVALLTSAASVLIRATF